ncbi:lipid storage droplets surface-binding protein 1-like [Lycorma delicatula]|uniref:lipid storage droplets surface-binding protein 1-like n=1 Tax=Lycorma delicatula TaxID=130591 RepID=UPI003F51649A
MADANTNTISAVSRVSKLPVVENTINAATNVYSMVKDYNPMVTTVFNKAENVVNTAKEVVQPITAQFEGPIKKVDSVMCSGLDYVEEKIPQIKLQPHEMYESAKNTIISTKDSVLSTVEPAVKCICQCAQRVADMTGLNKVCAAGDDCIFSIKKKVLKSTEEEKGTKENPSKDD